MSVRDAQATVDRKDAGPRSNWRANLLVGAVCGLTTFVWLALANRQIITSPVLEDGDFAANSILVDRAEAFRLLIGNYSRVGFNHPGPALLYAQAFGDIIVHRTLGIAPSSYGGQFAGILALNSVCVGIAGGVIRAVSGRWLAAAALLAVLPLINVWEPYALATTWMPGVYIAPFLLMVVAAAAVAGAHWGSLWALVAAASLCVHGHVSFVLFAGATAILAGLAGWLRVRRGAVGPAKGQLIAAAGVLVLFLLPIVANLVLHWPGEMARYLQFLGSDVGFSPRTAGDVAGFVGSFWVRGGLWLAAFFALSVALAVIARIADPRNAAARFRLDVVAFCVIETALFTYYAVRGVDNLEFDYVGWFLLSCPLLVLWAGLDSVLDVLTRRVERVGQAIGAAVCALLATVFLLVGTSANPYQGMPAALVAALPDGDVRLSFQTAGWPSGLGLLEQARRAGHLACVEGAAWAILVTPALVCTDASPGRSLLVLGPDEPRPDDVRYDDGRTALVVN
jgi:hypothetical protein